MFEFFALGWIRYNGDKRFEEVCNGRKKERQRFLLSFLSQVVSILCFHCKSATCHDSMQEGKSPAQLVLKCRLSLLKGVLKVDILCQLVLEMWGMPSLKFSAIVTLVTLLWPILFVDEVLIDRSGIRNERLPSSLINVKKLSITIDAERSDHQRKLFKHDVIWLADSSMLSMKLLKKQLVISCLSRSLSFRENVNTINSYCHELEEKTGLWQTKL